MSNGFDTIIKISKYIFYVEDGLKIANKTYWIFECCRYRRNSPWEENEYSNIWQMIA